MAASLDNPPILYDEDHAGGADGGEAVRDYDGSLSLHQTIERFEHQFFRSGVEARARLVHYQEGRVADDGAGNCNSLTLAAGECDAALADHRVVTLGHFHNKFMRVRQFGRLENFLACGFGPAVGDVGPDRSVE